MHGFNTFNERVINNICGQSCLVVILFMKLIKYFITCNINIPVVMTLRLCIHASYCFLISKKKKPLIHC